MESVENIKVLNISKCNNYLRREKYSFKLPPLLFPFNPFLFIPTSNEQYLTNFLMPFPVFPIGLFYFRFITQEKFVFCTNARKGTFLLVNRTMTESFRLHSKRRLLDAFCIASHFAFLAIFVNNCDMILNSWTHWYQFLNSCHTDQAIFVLLSVLEQ